MSTASTIADYIQHNRSLGKRFVAEEQILSAFGRSVDQVPLRNIRRVTIAGFVYCKAPVPRRLPRSIACWRGSSATPPRAAD